MGFLPRMGVKAHPETTQLLAALRKACELAMSEEPGVNPPEARASHSCWLLLRQHKAHIAPGGPQHAQALALVTALYPFLSSPEAKLALAPWVQLPPEPEDAPAGPFRAWSPRG